MNSLTLASTTVFAIQCLSHWESADMDVEFIFVGFSGLPQQNYSNNKNNNYSAAIRRAPEKAKQGSEVHITVPT
ncbi:hypothetical protein NG798_16870 [Ancylothrix sp. C2]|uniref:hypothetical protein n=1 Tax=Ancylothrix sp. D3o TaxID=2953691 RepID=UPI0021BB553F|nr:hypothetical protein [Ancylothrix sp. D3o]MCT7951477.1 hypothetical protein [Ancylothrix sp. D3o]